MPTSKQARARQNRQKQRVASAYIERDTRRRRRRQIGATLIVLAMVLIIALAFTVGSSGSGSKTAETTPTTAPVAATSNCVKLNDKLPNGAPNVPVRVGPAPTKLIIKDLKAGTGAVVKAHAKIEANYIGVACSTGKIFDSSYSRGKPTPFSLDQVIPGWTQGIPGMKLGGMRLLGIPADLAYGATGQGPIGPNEALWFVVQPVKIDG